MYHQGTSYHGLVDWFPTDHWRHDISASLPQCLAVFIKDCCNNTVPFSWTSSIPPCRRPLLKTLLHRAFPTRNGPMRIDLDEMRFGLCQRTIRPPPDCFIIADIQTMAGDRATLCVNYQIRYTIRSLSVPVHPSIKIYPWSGRSW